MVVLEGIFTVGLFRLIINKQENESKSGQLEFQVLFEILLNKIEILTVRLTCQNLEAKQTDQKGPWLC